MEKREEYRIFSEQQRLANLILKLARDKGLKLEERGISFRNNDVPNYLRTLDKFEERARRTNIRVEKRECYYFVH